MGNAETASVPHDGYHENSGGFQTALSFKSVYMWYVTGCRSHWGSDTQCQLQPLFSDESQNQTLPMFAGDFFPSFGAHHPLSLNIRVSLHCADTCK